MQATIWKNWFLNYVSLSSSASPARWSMAQTPSEAPPPAPLTHAQVTATVHTHNHPSTRMFGDTVTAHHVNKVISEDTVLCGAICSLFTCYSMTKDTYFLFSMFFCVINTESWLLRGQIRVCQNRYTMNWLSNPRELKVTDWSFIVHIGFSILLVFVIGSFSVALDQPRKNQWLIEVIKMK